MHRRSRHMMIVAGVVLLAAMLSGCGLFGKKDPVPELLSAGKSYTIKPGQGLGEDTEFQWYFEEYHDLEGKKLTDGTSGGYYLDGTYVGFRWTDVDEDENYIERDVTITIDLESSQNIGALRSHWAWDLTANIRYPDPLRVRVSEDGTTWSEPKSLPIDNPEDGGTPKWFSIDVNETGRYVRVEWTVKNSWYHVSEIQVYAPGK